MAACCVHDEHFLVARFTVSTGTITVIEKTTLLLKYKNVK
jgi:hypothetical protein